MMVVAVMVVVRRRRRRCGKVQLLYQQSNKEMY
jgi:hypothetical protein